MKKKRPSDPARRKLVGFFKVPPDDAGPEAERAWINGVLDAMERVDREDASERAAKRANAKQGRKQHPRSGT